MTHPSVTRIPDKGEICWLMPHYLDGHNILILFPTRTPYAGNMQTSDPVLVRITSVPLPWNVMVETLDGRWYRAVDLRRLRLLSPLEQLAAVS